jgi:hypothetical protein
MTVRPGVLTPALRALPFILFLVAGCASPRYSEDYPMGATTGVSGDGVLRYGVPRGWFASPPDTISANVVVWLLRRDFAATLTVSEIMVDSAAEITVRREGVESLARLTMNLVTGEHAGIFRQGPETFRLGNHVFCSYETETADRGDVTRVAVFFTPSKIYEVTALARKGENTERVFAAHQAFLKSLRWQAMAQ